MRDFGGLSPFPQISFGLDKFKVRFYQYEKNTTTLQFLSPSFSTFTHWFDKQVVVIHTKMGASKGVVDTTATIF